MNLLELAVEQGVGVGRVEVGGSIGTAMVGAVNARAASKTMRAPKSVVKYL